MKVTMKSLTDVAVERRDYRDALTISIDGKKEFMVFDGELEDATLGRDFNDCWSIGNLMEKAYKAGVAGESFEIELIQVDEI